MKDYVIITDSTSDLGKEVREKYGIDYVKMNISYTVKDVQKEQPASLDWDLYSPKELYDLMRKGIRVMTTQVPVVEYEKVFTKYLKEGKDIIYIACSSALSGSINVANAVKLDLLETYKDSKIYCIDSLISCLGEGLIAIDAAVMRNEGKSIEEVYEYIEKNKLKYQQIATVESLEYLKRAGRVKTSTAFFGNLFSVKPMIISDAKGNNYAYKKIKGRRASLLEVINTVKEKIIDPENQIICICHADSIEDANFLKEHLEKEIKCKEFFMSYIGPIIGASVGPGTVAVYYKGEEVTVVGE